MTGRIIFTSTRPWRWIASDLLDALKLAREEIRNPGAGQRAGKDIEAIITRAIRATTEDDNVTH